MAIKNLLVAYNGDVASDTALHLALQMANKYDAHLTGIAAHGASNVTKNIPNWLSSTMRSSIGEIMERRTSELAEKFKSFTEGEVEQSRVHWIDVKADPDKAVAFYSRLFDLTVLGQYENLIAADELLLHPGRIAYASGRPILVAPKMHMPVEINDHVVVAWDGQRSASRAFFDAMQVLETMNRLSIVTVGEPGCIQMSTEIDLPTILARHGVAVKHSFLPNMGSVAETLLRHCADVGAGMLVMGAYEHSKLSDDLFGGTTSSVIQRATVPLFLSH